WPLLTAFALAALVALWWARAPYVYVEFVIWVVLVGGGLGLLWTVRAVVRGSERCLLARVPAGGALSRLLVGGDARWWGGTRTPAGTSGDQRWDLRSRRVRSAQCPSPRRPDMVGCTIRAIRSHSDQDVTGPSLSLARANAVHARPNSNSPRLRRRCRPRGSAPPPRQTSTGRPKRTKNWTPCPAKLPTIWPMEASKNPP